MRPVNKGKNNKSFNTYQDARGDLIDRLGEYCSYCEMHMDSGLAVEHIQPKHNHRELKCKWENFLLSCFNCNSSKGSDIANPADYLWPHKDNTYRAFKYIEGGRVTVNPTLTPRQKECAQNLLDLVGLQKTPRPTPKESDRRWKNHKEAWDKAVDALNDLINNNTDEMRRSIVDHATARGYWSVWMTVFIDEPDMRKRFIESFNGTCKVCFDKEGKPRKRKNGQV